MSWLALFHGDFVDKMDTMSWCICKGNHIWAGERSSLMATTRDSRWLLNGCMAETAHYCPCTRQCCTWRSKPAHLDCKDSCCNMA